MSKFEIMTKSYILDLKHAQNRLILIYFLINNNE